VERHGADNPSVSRRAKTDAALVEVESLDDLEAQERSLSAARRRLHDVIDFMRPQNPAQRTPQGEQLKHLEQKEKELSTRRRTLHGLIDSLRGR
jgi:hypothetical protein